MWDPLHAAVGAEVVEQRTRRGLLSLEAQTRSREQRGLGVGEEEHVGALGLARRLARAEDAQRNPRALDGIVRCTGMPSPELRPCATAAVASNLAAMKYGDRRE